ncbi:MAG: alpha-L-arabinofuranosidase, partial [Clostridia bacterium]|nr:alpha-L-arabinofuranosidase [Clostridia bacterium]
MKNITIENQKLHSISQYLYMQFMEPLGIADSSVDAGWDYEKNCWQPCLMEKIKELSPTMIRFGGCFASFYHWREAVGPREQRIPMLNQCWGGIYSNQVGTHEIMQMCRVVGAEPRMNVNTE